MRKDVLCFNVERIKFFFIALLCFASNKKVAAQVINYDSLRQVVAVTKDEKVKIKTLLFLADWYSAIPDSEYHYAVLAKDAAAKIYDKSSEAYAMGCIGETYLHRGNIVKAFSLSSQALKTFEELKDTARLANTYILIGGVYDSQRNYTAAKNYYLKCYKLAGRIKDYQDQFYGTLNLELVYRELN
jgi:tetratricopeptide (TPR) repeat protein